MTDLETAQLFITVAACGLFAIVVIDAILNLINDLDKHDDGPPAY